MIKIMGIPNLLGIFLSIQVNDNKLAFPITVIISEIIHRPDNGKLAGIHFLFKITKSFINLLVNIQNNPLLIIRSAFHIERLKFFFDGRRNMAYIAPGGFYGSTMGMIHENKNK